MLGPSGSGKTTTLRLIAGFELPDAGTRRARAARTSRALPPYARDVNTVFQDYALFPHMTVGDNVEYGLQDRARSPRRSGARRAGEALEMVRLAGYGDRKPAQLSGGQRQRVALARAIVNRPRVLLLDEPLGALDLKLRQEMQVELKRIQREVGITFVYVTHDQEEALTMSDRLAVFNDGPDRAGRRARRGLRAPGERVRRRLRRRLERRSSATGGRFTVRPEKVRILDAGEPADGLHVEAGTDRATSPTSGWSRATRSSSTRAASCRSCSRTSRRRRRRRSSRRGRRVRVGWRAEHTFAIDETRRSSMRRSRDRGRADRRRAVARGGRVRRQRQLGDDEATAASRRRAGRRR